MSGFVWFLAKKAWLSLFSADKDHSVSACQRRCFITHILSQQSWYLRVCVCVFSGLLMFGWSVWYVNVMLMHHSNQPSATWWWRRRLSVSHVTSARVCQNLSVELWRRNLWFVLRNSMSSMQFLFLSSFYLAEDSVSCENPGLPDNGYQILSKRLYLPGESLTFVCYQGYELIGEVAIKCILGNPSFWSGPLPLCRGEIFEGHFILIYVIIEIF